MAVEAENHISDEAFVLVREDVGAGTRWTLPSDGVAIGRASRIVTTVAGVLFLGGVVMLFASPVLDSDILLRGLTGAWTVAIVLALAAAHWRAIAGEPIVLEVQPEQVTLHNPAYLVGRTRRWPVARVRSFRLMHRGNALTTGRPIGNLFLCTRWRWSLLFVGLEIPELQEVIEQMHEITAVPVTR